MTEREKGFYRISGTNGLSGRSAPDYVAEWRDGLWFVSGNTPVIIPETSVGDLLQRTGPLPPMHFTDDATMPQPSAWIPEQNAVRLAKLGKCVEEMGEAISMLGRCICQGIGESDPKTGENNALHLHDEFADVRASMELVTEEIRSVALEQRLERDLDVHFLRRIERKLTHKRGWHRMLREMFPPRGDRS